MQEDIIVQLDMFNNKQQKHEVETVKEIQREVDIELERQMDWVEIYGVDTESFAKYTKK